MAKISFPLLDKRFCSISFGVSGKEDFFKHTCASMVVKAQASAADAVTKVMLEKPFPDA